MANRYEPANTSSNLKLFPFAEGTRYTISPASKGVKKSTSNFKVIVAVRGSGIDAELVADFFGGKGSNTFGSCIDQKGIDFRMFFQYLNSSLVAHYH